MKVNQVLCGNSIEIMENFDANSIDALVTDGPYGWGFMGADWDKFTSKEYQNFCFEWGSKAIEILKPGAYCLSFSAPKKYHRMACGLEDAGFKIKDMINWVFGCLSEDTEILTLKGWEHYHKSIFKSPILCYDNEKNSYIFDKPKRVYIYQNKYPAYRIKSDFTDQIVSRNHRCLIERKGRLVFQRAETLQPEENIPFLEGLQDLPETIYNLQSHTSEKKQDLLKRVFIQEDKKGKKKQYKANRTAQRKEKSYLCGMWERILPKYKAFKKSKTAMLFSTLQWCFKRRRLEEICSSWKERMDRGKHEKLSQENERSKQSRLERWNNLLQNKGKLYWSKICSMSKRILIYGSKGWLCNGTPLNYSSTLTSLPYSARSSSSHRSRSFKQPNKKSKTIQKQYKAQVIRRTRAKIQEIEYYGKIWCVKVSTGAFVARRNGKIFITGNSGFPKNLDISKAIDKYYGIENEREVIGTRYRHGGGKKDQYMQMTADPKVKITEPVTLEAKQWDGWGTGLKPGHEDIVLAQKPYEGTYAKNILKWGVGALNINACRIDYIKEKEIDSRIYNQEKNITRGHHENATIKYAPDGNEFPMYKTQKGRWPSNVILDPISAEMLDQQSGISKGGTPKHNREIKRKGFSGNGPFNDLSCGFDVNKCKGLANFGDKGGASRFFYCAKTHVNERNAGCEDLYWEKINDNFKKITKKQYNLLPAKKRAKDNPISTLKPINLMRYLVRLVTPPNGTVLDLFAGSGTTGIACIIEEFNYILIEKRKCFAEIIIPKRLKWWEEPNHWEKLKDHPLLPKIQIKINKKQNVSLDTWA